MKKIDLLVDMNLQNIWDYINLAEIFQVRILCVLKVSNQKQDVWTSLNT